jgi:CheY-like chemotaxis protein
MRLDRNLADPELAADRADAGFNCVLMDGQMPDMDGFECTTVIRTDERISGRHMPIIAMTAHAMKGDETRCLALGMDVETDSTGGALRADRSPSQFRPVRSACRQEGRLTGC